MRNERIAQRAARAVYGSIVALAVIVVLDKASAEADEVIAAVIGSVIAATLAEQYAEYIAHVIRERRHLTAPEIVQQAKDGAAGALAALVPLVPFLAVEFDGSSCPTAYEIAPWLGLGVIGVLLAARQPRGGVAGARQHGGDRRSRSAIGASLIVIKTVTH